MLSFAIFGVLLTTKPTSVRNLSAMRTSHRLPDSCHIGQVILEIEDFLVEPTRPDIQSFPILFSKRSPLLSVMTKV
jgi:hypothetical protein